MITCTVHASSTYDVLIGGGLLLKAGALIRPVLSGRACVITDTTVGPLYLAPLMKSLADAGIDTVSYAYPAGEEHKTLEEYAKILTCLTEQRISRADYIIALGGGVCGDMAGFAAATYLRGIPFVQIPTSFLAAADASVGGKTAVDLPSGKNLVGAFHQPSLVIIDTDTFATLPPAMYEDGMAETIKHALISDRAFFDALSSEVKKPSTEEMVRKDVEIKSRFVAADEFDKGLRQMLNFGHTIGHTIEKNSHFTISHGHAVSMGMYAAAKGAYAFGLAKEDYSPCIKKVLGDYHISVECPFTAETLAETALLDKKRFGDVIHIIYLKEIGEAAIHSLPVEQLADFLAAGLA